MNDTWLSGIVLHGDQQGRTIGFPTANFSPDIFPKTLQEGVYACLVKKDAQLYRGALFYGPRMIHNETHPVLEIYILDFNKTIYGETISFLIKDFIRPVKKLTTSVALQEAIKDDIDHVRQMLPTVI